jgi:hypothetical protein
MQEGAELEASIQSATAADVPSLPMRGRTACWSRCVMDTRRPGHRIASRLYKALFFDERAGQDVHCAHAQLTLPNPTSIALHTRFGFHELNASRQELPVRQHR